MSPFLAFKHNFLELMHYLVWALLTIIYSPIFYKLYCGRWHKIDYTHAYFILPVSLLFVWQKRSVLKALTLKRHSRSNILGLALTILGALMFVFGWRQDYLFISTLSLIPILFGITSYLYNNGVVKTLFFPILYLSLLVPPPLGILDSITLPLRYGISVITEMILKALHYPINREGLLLMVGKSEIYMGAPCSGFRSLITMISLGLAYVYITKGTAKKRIILLSSIIPLTMMGNLMRVVSTCLAAFYFGNTITSKFHDISGYAIFAILILGMMGIDSLLDRCKI